MFVLLRHERLRPMEYRKNNEFLCVWLDLQGDSRECRAFSLKTLIMYCVIVSTSGLLRGVHFLKRLFVVCRFILKKRMLGKIMACRPRLLSSKFLYMVLQSAPYCDIMWYDVYIYRCD